ncbi:hypothetical protein RM780_14270 [Streptomyces sp. DSM 44917]|uniref:Uncharacterized protein n=1 Tax=Streptomyces boetiae TaxID=3075541 RepID=A0ABU2L973_9ACTN|nr:hypothetical protein [Streptomyces sp. DSM 44917]MDT0308120.1 hypothetical protein [Streptomyces sp. DSM 44917]
MGSTAAVLAGSAAVFASQLSPDGRIIEEDEGAIEYQGPEDDAERAREFWTLAELVEVRCRGRPGPRSPRRG